MPRGVPWLNWIVLIVIGLAVLLKVILPITPTAQKQAEDSSCRLAAAELDGREPSSGTGSLNSDNWGGYLLWRLWPEYPIYTDGRTDVYDNAFLQEHPEDRHRTVDAPAVFDERGIKVVMVEARIAAGSPTFEIGPVASGVSR